MAFVNTYRAPDAALPADPYGPDPWDINFVFPIPPAIESARVRLTPFVPRAHADGFWDAAGGADRALYRFIKRPFRNKDDLLAFLSAGQASADTCTFLVVDKTRPEVEGEGTGLGGAMAGMISYVSASAANRVRAAPRRVPF
jgi:hypothetical protein